MIYAYNIKRGNRGQKLQKSVFGIFCGSVSCPLLRCGSPYVIGSLLSLIIDRMRFPLAVFNSATLFTSSLPENHFWIKAIFHFNGGMLSSASSTKSPTANFGPAVSHFFRI